MKGAPGSVATSLSLGRSFPGGAVVQPRRWEGILVTHGAEFFGGPAECSAARRSCAGVCGILRQIPSRVFRLLCFSKHLRWWVNPALGDSSWARLSQLLEKAPPPDLFPSALVEALLGVRATFEVVSIQNPTQWERDQRVWGAGFIYGAETRSQGAKEVPQVECP